MKPFRSLRPFVAAALAALVLSPVFSTAAPFAEWLQVPVPGGGTVRVWGEGDEYDAWFETADGHALRVNDAAGRYEYVDVDPATGAYVGTGVLLGDEAGHEALLAALPLHARDTSEAHREAVAARAAEIQAVVRDDERWAEAQKRGAERAAMLEKAAAGKVDPDSPEFTHATSGRYVGVTILVDFPLLDASGNVTNSLSKTISTKYNVTAVDAMMNGENYTTDGSIASMREYWSTVSDGAVDYSNVVIDWVMAPHPREYYNDTTQSSGTCGRKLIGDILGVMAADPDFDTKYLPKLQQATLNGSSAHALNVIYAGYDSGTWSKGLWPHRWSLTSTQYSKMYWTMPNGTRAYFYDYEITDAANSLYNDTLLHENGHMICGFPDLYAASHSDGYGVGGFCLMCYHSSGPAVCAPLRVGAGWATPKTLPAQGWVTVTSDRKDVWKFANPSNSREFFMFENRQKKGLDKGIAGSGILIWRVDESYSNNQYPSSTIRSNFAGHPATNRWAQYLSLEQADGRYDIERGSGSHGDSTDPWYAGNSAGPTTTMPGAGCAGVFDYGSAACSRWKNGSDSGLKLSHFSASGDTMTFFVGDPSTWPEPFVDIRLKSAAGEAATFTALVESWGSGASSADVYAEIGSDAAFTQTLSSTKIGTMTQLNTSKDWQIDGLTIGTPHYVRLKLKNSAGEFVSPVATLDYTPDGDIPPAVDAPQVLFWQTPGNPKNWFVATDKTHKGSTSAKSGKITHNQTTTLNATVTGPGTFSFWWNVSSESVSWDWHAYTTSWNPATTNKIGGTSVNWAQVTLQVPAGSQTITWSYRKDGSADGGSDCAWLDDVVWRPDAAAPVLTAAAAGDAGVSAVDVAWTLENLSTGATSCDLFLEYSTSSSFPSASTTTVPIGSAMDMASGTWTLTGLAAGTTYYVRAKGVSNTNKTGYSEPFTVATANPAFPDFAFSVAPSETVTRGVVTIDVSSFGTGASSSGTATIEYATTPDFAGAKTETASLTRTGATSVTLARLSAGTTYYVRVTVRNSQNKSFTRGPKTFATADPGFYQPGLAQVRYGCTGSSYPDFTVTVANNSSTYAIERTPGPIMADITGSGPSTVNPYTGTTWKWSNNSTFYYEGEMFFKGGVAYNFFHYVDDGVAIELDGEWFTRQSASNVSGYNAGATVASKTFATDGWHPIRIWVYDWTGSSGYCTQSYNPGMGIGWNTNGCTTANAANNANWSTLRDPGDASLLRTLSGAELPSFVTLNDDLTIAGTTLTGSIHTDGVEDGCTITLYAGQSNAGSNTVGWAQSKVLGTVPSEEYALPFSWADFCAAGDSAGWFVIARMTNASGSYEGWSLVRQPAGQSAPALGAVGVATTKTAATLTVPVTSLGAGGASVTVSATLGGATKTATLSAPGEATFVFDGLTADTEYAWSVSAVVAPTGLAATPQSGVATTQGVQKETKGWFFVDLSDAGYAAFPDVSGVAAPGGTWSGAGEFSATYSAAGRTLAIARSESAAADAELRYTPTKPTESGCDAEVRGTFVPNPHATVAGIPQTGALAGIAFVSAGAGLRPYGLAGGTWAPQNPVVANGAPVAWAAQFDFSSARKPRVRYAIGAVTNDWMSMSAATKLSAVAFRGSGTLGSFRGAYARVVGSFAKPEFGAASADGSALGFGTDPATGRATFSVTIDNATDDADYAVYVCDTVDGDYVLDAAATQSGASEFRTFTMVDDAATKFVKIVAAEPGYAFPQRFADIAF